MSKEENIAYCDDINSEEELKTIEDKIIGKTIRSLKQEEWGITIEFDNSDNHIFYIESYCDDDECQGRYSELFLKIKKKNNE
jgi:hypothetical protein